MLEEYLKKFEEMITPNHYTKENLKEQLNADLIKSPKMKEQPKSPKGNPIVEINLGTPIKTEINPYQGGLEITLKDEGQFQSSPKNIKSPSSKLKSPNTQSKEKIKEDNMFISSAKKSSNQNEVNKENNKEEMEEAKIQQNEEEINPELNNIDIENLPQSGQLSKKESKVLQINNSIKIGNKEYTESDIRQLMEKVNNLNKKNMNYRYDIEKLKSKIEELEAENNQQKEEINKLEKQKENLAQYIIRLESTLSVKTSSGGRPGTSNINRTTSINNA